MSTILNCSTISKQIFNPVNYNILIVEDSKPINKILYKRFTTLGYNCFTAFTLSEAREILENNTIHYLMLDINLPDGNGYEIIKELKDTPEKIFVLTTETDKQFRDISYQKGVIDFIVKDKDFFNKINQITASIEQLEKNKNKTILVIDDSFVIQEQLKDILQNRHYNVEIAGDTKTALNILSNKNIDLILLDVELNGENGIEFLEKNKNDIINIQNIPVMIVSGNTEAAIIRNGLKAGAKDIIKKPYIIEEIVLKSDMWIDYKRKEEEVLCSTQLLKEYKNAVDESSIVSKSTPSGIITFVNDNFCKISGFKEAELLGQNHSIVRHPDMDKEIFKDLWNTIKVQKKTWHGKVKNRKKDGGYYWVDAVIKPIIDVQGNIVEFIGLRTDITDTENAKDELKKQYSITSDKYDEVLSLSKLYEEAIEESNIILRVDLNHNISYCNDHFCEVSGYSKKELIGQPYSMISHSDANNKNVEEMWDTINNGNIWKGKLKNISKNGSDYYSLSTVVPIKNKDGEIIEYIGIRKDITELINLHTEIEETQRELIYRIGEIGESRSKETGQHVKRVAEYSYLLAILYGIDKEEAEILKMASPMHDIGKVGIADSILNKPGKLTYEEFETIKNHSTIGYEMLKGSNRPILQASAIVSNEHHEKWDGTGYPNGLKGKDIHIYGRITAIADVFDALGHDRCYKPAWELDKIYNLFDEGKGTHFDPKLVELFFKNKDKFLEIRDRFNNETGE